MCENIHCESVYFKELHNEQEYYRLTIYRTGAAVVSTITSYRNVCTSITGGKVRSLNAGLDGGWISLLLHLLVDCCRTGHGILAFKYV